jgi:hypothetical protein
MAVATVRIRYQPELDEKWGMQILVDQCPAWDFQWLCFCEKRIGHEGWHRTVADDIVDDWLDRRAVVIFDV